MDSGRSFINAKNSLDRALWNTREYLSEDLVPSSKTDCFLWLRKDSVQRRV